MSKRVPPNPLANWHEEASVRSQDRRILDSVPVDKIFFPRNLVPAVAHPRVTALGEDAVRRLLVQHLYIYLDFTEELEHRIVNNVCYSIARGTMPIDLPKACRLDGYKIYIDEAYHAMFSADLSQQVEGATGVTPVEIHASTFLGQFERQLDEIDPGHRDLLSLFFAIVSETLITTTLSQALHDGNVVSTVREVIKDHAVDESRHHAYFAELLATVWPRLSAAEQRVVGPRIPELILSFLRPNRTAILAALGDIGLNRRQAEAVFEESMGEDYSLPQARKASSSLIKHLRQSGVFEHDETHDMFKKVGLL